MIGGIPWDKMSASDISVPWREACWRLLEIMEVSVLLNLLFLQLKLELFHQRVNLREYLQHLIIQILNRDKITGAHTAAGHSEWILPGSTHKLPCPLQNRDHEIASCTEMFKLTPKDCWSKITRGRICYTCVKPKGPKGLCKNKRCSEEKGIPQVLLCAACTPWAATKGWAPFNILMC